MILKIHIYFTPVFVSVVVSSQPRFIDVTLFKNIADFNAAPTLGSGVNAVDYDKDGDIDLYVLSDEHTPNQLYRNTGSGNFEIAEVGLSLMMRSRAAVWFDYDGDHRLDVFIAGDCHSCSEDQSFRLFRQKEDGTFLEMTANAGINLKLLSNSTLGGVTAGDVNNDGFLDLLITQYPGEATLYMNEGNGMFKDATQSSLIKDAQLYLQPVIFDFNNDGWADIYLAVDYHQNQFWLNNADGTFTEIGEQINLDNDDNDMGMAIGDYDRDGDMDIYISNIYDPKVERHHNVLFRNEIQKGELYFNEVSKELGVDDGGWGWGVSFLDFNNDGFLDLAATNGWVTETKYQSKLWLNDGGKFSDVSLKYGFNDFLNATTLISLDFDRDGDLDLAQTLKENEGQQVAIRLLENQLAGSYEFKNYLTVKPRMLGTNYWAIGSTVKIRTGNVIQTYPIKTGVSFYGQEPAEAHFGVGEATNIDEVTIIWPGGAESKFFNIDINQSVTITDEQVLHIPVHLSAKPSVNSVLLHWQHVHSSETKYLIERSSTPDFQEVESFEVGSSEQYFTDLGLESLSDYYYRVTAFNESMYSEPGKWVKTRTKSAINTPSEVRGEVLSLSSLKVSWIDNADNEDGYLVQRSLSADFASYTSIILEANITEMIDERLEPQTTYYYRLAAFTGEDISDYSSSIDIATMILGLSKAYSFTNVYPNPTNGMINLETNDQSNCPSSIKLFDTSGKVVETFPFNSHETSSRTFHINQPSGLYFLNFTYPNGQIESVKVVVE